MARADSAELVAGWASDRAIDLWVVFGEDCRLAAAVEDGAIVRSLSDDSSPFTVFETMRSVGVDDVRRVGVAAAHPEGLRAGRRAGVGAVVGIEAGASTSELLAAEPDAVVGRIGLC